MFDAQMMLVFSYSLWCDWVNLCLAPKYLSRNVIVGGTVEDTGAEVGINMDLVGTNFGVALGRDFSLYLEGGIYAPSGFDGHVIHAAVGFDF
jgi:hypothetical protein